MRLLSILISLTATLLFAGCGDTDTCTPDCADKCAGDDGCGGLCIDNCTTDTYCSLETATCTEKCRSLADCANYGENYTCDLASGRCTCVPQCTDKCEGSDECGGYCPDNCPAGTTCNKDTDRCEA